MVEIPKPEVMIWDLDGTMLNSFGIYSSIVTQVSAEWEIPEPSPESLRHNFHGRLEESIGNTINLTGSDLEKFVDHFLEVQESYYEHPADHLYSDALRLAQQGNSIGVKQIIVTNREHQFRGKASPFYFVGHTLLKELIDNVITADTTDFRKPDPRVIAHYVPTQGNDRRLLVIGDQHVDAQFARNLGAPAVIVNRHLDDVPHMHTVGDGLSPIHEVESLDEVIIL